MGKGKANSTKDVATTPLSIAAGQKFGGGSTKRIPSISIGEEVGSGRSKGARRNSNIGTVC
jgi:hypothetical protein